MEMFESYTVSLWGILVIIATLLVQALVASVVKSRAPGTVPGKIDESLSHDSFVFRTHRTVMNSLENISAMLGTSFLAILAGANIVWTAVFIWIFAIARIIHMVLYYAIATEKNPSPRSYFFLLGLVANIALLILAAVALA